MIRIVEKTSRCTVRFLEEGGYGGFVDGCNGCYPSRNRFDEGCIDTSFMTGTWYHDLLERRRKEAEGDYSYLFHIFRSEDGRAIGCCDVTALFREGVQFAKIGYTSFHPYWVRALPPLRWNAERVRLLPDGPIQTEAVN